MGVVVSAVTLRCLLTLSCLAQEQCPFDGDGAGVELKMGGGAGVMTVSLLTHLDPSGPACKTARRGLTGVDHCGQAGSCPRQRIAR